ncbi:MAG: hypothetical protein FWE01_01095 [Firmicutes bacterium]|nr:hypothetical protein [Bacillota bacterium]
MKFRYEITYKDRQNTLHSLYAVTERQANNLVEKMKRYGFKIVKFTDLKHV